VRGRDRARLRVRLWVRIRVKVGFRARVRVRSHQPCQRSAPLPVSASVVTAHDVALTGTLSCGASVTRSAWVSEYASTSSFSGAVKPTSSSITCPG